VQNILNDIQNVIAPQRFNPAITKEEFTVSILDYAEMMIGSSFMQRINEKAPNSTILIEARTTNTDKELLSGDVDITFGATSKKYPNSFTVEHL